MRLHAICCVAVLACGSADKKPGQNQVSGTIAGRALAAQDAASVQGAFHGFGFSGSSTLVQIADYANLCSLESSNHALANSSHLDLVLAQIDTSGGATPPSVPGIYVVTPLSQNPNVAGTLRAQVWFAWYGASCFKESWASGTSGAVTVLEVSAAGIQGTFDVFLDSGDHVTGSFDAPDCAGMDPNRSQTCP